MQNETGNAAGGNTEIPAPRIGHEKAEISYRSWNYGSLRFDGHGILMFKGMASGVGRCVCEAGMKFRKSGSIREFRKSGKLRKL